VSAAHVLGLLGGVAAGQAMVAAVRLGVFDHLARGPQTVDALATAIGGDPRVLVRVLRVAQTHGLLTADAEGRFANTASGDVLRADHPGSLAPHVLCIRDETIAAMGALDRAVLGPPCALEHAYGEGLWARLARDPAAEAAFLAFMDASIRSAAPAVVAAVDWAPARVVVDVGGGRGTLLSAALEAHPHLRGVLFDVPAAFAGSPDAATRLPDRCARIEGDYRREVPEGADVYLLCRVLHGWDDDGCRVVLSRCRHAMAPGGRVVVVERVRPEAPNRVDALADLRTMAHTGGEERTRADFERVFAAAGLRLARVAAAGPWMSVIEGVARTQ
jgi:hypothetical protein